MKIYISGQITGLNYVDAFEKFKTAEKEINEETSHEAVNPMTLSHDHDQSWENYMLEDIKALFECQAIYMLNNWGSSKGARIERSIAIEMGLEIMYEK